ncbi:MAG: S4 domain-containing protein YaaA [Bacilli bacterium]
MKTIKIDSEWITLGQLLKLEAYIGTGGQAKWFLSEHDVTVNEEPEDRRGRKLYVGDTVVIQGEETFVIA